MVVVVDLDGCKGINDTYGHQIGDAFLIHLTRLLEQTVEPLGFAARVGGDEFFLLLQNQTPDHGISLDTLIHHADQAMYHIKYNGKNGYRIHDTLYSVQRPSEGGTR